MPETEQVRLPERKHLLLPGKQVPLPGKRFRRHPRMGRIQCSPQGGKQGAGQC